MARPSKPLISREATVKAALALIDAEGLDALSLPRLARELHVKAPSLYYHFSDKDEVLAAVARAVVAKTVVPRKPAQPDWFPWFTQLAMNVREAVLRHRQAAPILLRHMPRELLTDIYEDAAVYLVECGVPMPLLAQILDGLEKLTLGSAIAEAMDSVSRWRFRFEHADPGRHPVLTAASDANRLTSKQIFERTVRSYLLGVASLGFISPVAAQDARAVPGA
ncbi:TetR/AcrR family transcriptional regulator [Mycolicibacterium holsaticum]|uniref:TetR family transcriptional regulator n=1 Tax=Mycolicibacterium holsaticum TaxID=152142 RepID=A0A1E3RXF0_9MYCO|nr:TetR/AcrR family transcriptional regulator [Mycolicibacterium holsaticum]ODQ94092.1 TetR family transcriptional regulator [Mycolicibacterium holsaticum]